MKKYVLICFFVLSLLNLSISKNITDGQFILRGAGNETGNSIIETVDGNYLYCGTTTSYGSGGKDILVVKFGKDFSIIWQKTIGGVNDEFVTDRPSLIENPDGTIVIMGNTDAGIIGDDDFLLIKLDADGNVLWSKAYGGTSNERGLTVEKYLDGGYLMGGNTYSYPVGKNNIYLIRVNELGDVIWNWSFGNTIRSATQLSDILISEDSSIFVCGAYDGFPSQSNSYIAKLDKNGLLQWIKTYTSSSSSGSGWEGVTNLKLMNNSIIATGSTIGASQHGGGDALLINLDFDGNVLWSKVYGGTGNEWFYELKVDTNQDITIGVYSNSVGFGDYDIGLVKLDSLGNVINYNVYGSTGIEHFKFFSTTSDGGIIFFRKYYRI